MYSKTVWTYGPDNVIVIVGVLPILSWNKVTVKKLQPHNIRIDGVYAEHKMVKSFDLSARFTLTVPGASSANSLISSQVRIFESKFGTDGLLPLIVLDTFSGSLHVASHAKLITEPILSYGKTQADKKWIFEGDLDISVNNAVSAVTNSVMFIKHGFLNT